MDDRRRSPRVEPRRPLRAKVKASVPARIVDISSGGAQLEVVTSLRPQVTCEIRLQLDEGEVILNSTVRRCRAWGFGFDERDRKVLLYRAGVQFEELPGDVVASIKRELAEQGLGSGAYAKVETPAGTPGPEPTGDTAPSASAKVAAPHRDGPVKIRIRSDHVRGILDGEKKK